MQRGHPAMWSFLSTPRAFRRSAISRTNWSSVSSTRFPRSMNMFETERFPEPCQFLGSGMFGFAVVLSISATMWRIVPLGRIGA